MHGTAVHDPFQTPGTAASESTSSTSVHAAKLSEARVSDQEVVQKLCFNCRIDSLCKVDSPGSWAHLHTTFGRKPRNIPSLLKLQLHLHPANVNHILGLGPVPSSDLHWAGICCASGDPQTMKDHT